ncbi:hypothetical protein, partial [Kitasatospora nipponensis]|uniref:hypothetical protein n=1 Tax=Kitasatospora nipponensis TaxID=258049 RepID=UPI0031DBA46E
MISNQDGTPAPPGRGLLGPVLGALVAALCTAGPGWLAGTGYARSAPPRPCTAADVAEGVEQGCHGADGLAILLGAGGTVLAMVAVVLATVALGIGFGIDAPPPALVGCWVLATTACALAGASFGAGRAHPWVLLAAGVG